MRLLRLAAIMAALAMPAAAADRALVIGIDRYPHYPPQLQLNDAVDDAVRMAFFANAEWGFARDEIIQLMDERATRAGILAAFERLERETAPGDRVLIYYSGHGTQVPDDNRDEGDGFDEAIVPHDAYGDGERHRNVVRDDEIGAMLARLPGRRVTMIVDACQSATLSRGRSGPVSYRARYLPRSAARARSRGFSWGVDAYEHLDPPAFSATREETGILDTEPAHVALWTAVSASQLAIESGGGVFTNAMLAGLGGAADKDGDGVVAAAELLRYVRKAAVVYCRAPGRCAPDGMTPQFSGAAHHYGQPLLSTRPTGPEPVGAILSGEENGGTIAFVHDAVPRHGDKINFVITHPRGGRFALFDVAEDGTVTNIFPQMRETRDITLRPGAPLIYPDYPKSAAGFSYYAERGRGEIIVIVAHDQVSALGRGGSATRDVGVIPNPREHFGALAQELFDVYRRDGDANRAVSWSLMRLPYDIGD